MNYRKEDGFGNLKAHEAHKVRCQSAVERQAYRDSLTDEQQITRLDTRGYAAAKERDRLNTRIAAKNNPVRAEKEEGSKGKKNLKGKQKKLAEQADE